MVRGARVDVYVTSRVSQLPRVAGHNYSGAVGEEPLAKGGIGVGVAYIDRYPHSLQKAMGTAVPVAALGRNGRWDIVDRNLVVGCDEIDQAGELKGNELNSKCAIITNYLAISDTLGTAGQPTSDQFAAIRAARYEVVVNLAMPDSPNALPNEGELVAAEGMDYVHIPVVWESPTMADLERFFAAMDQNRGRKVFVHCALNMRVSCFVCLYRVLRLGIPVEEAWQDVLAIWEPNETWQQFMEKGKLLSV